MLLLLSGRNLHALQTEIVISCRCSQCKEKLSFLCIERIRFVWPSRGSGFNSLHARHNARQCINILCAYYRVCTGVWVHTAHMWAFSCGAVRDPCDGRGARLGWASACAVASAKLGSICRHCRSCSMCAQPDCLCINARRLMQIRNRNGTTDRHSRSN